MRLLADENFHRAITRGLLRQQPGLDLVRVQDVGLAGVDDPEVLTWAAEGRVVLTHDAETLIAAAYARARAGLAMPGVIEVSQEAPIGTVIADLLLLIGASRPDEWAGQVLYVPL